MGTEIKEIDESETIEITTLLFDSSNYVKAKKDVDSTEVLDIIKDICKLTKTGIKHQHAKALGKLVESLKAMSTDNFVNLATEIEKEEMCPFARSIFHDALPMVKTAGSIAAMRDLVISEAVAGFTADTWMASLHFITNPTLEMIVETMPLFDTITPHASAWLGVSAMVNKFCKVEDCKENEYVNKIMLTFEKYLYDDCTGAEGHIKLALTSIANTGLAHMSIDTLTKCIFNDQASAFIKATAITTFRKSFVKPEISTFLPILTNEAAPSLMRVEIYHQFIETENEELINYLVETLKTEKVDEFSSLVFTHLSTLVEDNANLETIFKSLLESYSKLSLNKSKFMSKEFFSEDYNMGAELTNELFWNENSMVPHTAVTNLHADLFGEKVNLFKLGANIEGIEKMIQSLIKKLNEKDAEAPLDFEELKLTAFFGMFGNDMSLSEFDGMAIKKIGETFDLKEWSYMDFILSLAEQKDIVLTKAMNIMDAEISVPTIMGVPLKLTAKGNALLDINVHTKFDVFQMLTGNMDVAVHTRPSALIEIDADMFVDAWFTQTGVKMHNNLHTNTFIDLKAEMKDGKLFNFELNFPEDEMHIFDAQTTFATMFNDFSAESTSVMTNEFVVADCFGKDFFSVFGVDVCGAVRMPLDARGSVDVSPLAGAREISLKMVKRDTMDKFSFHAEIFNDEMIGAMISFNIPGSQMKRELTFKTEFDTNNNRLDVDIITPWTTFSAAGFVTKDEDQIGFYTEAVVDNLDKYEFHAKCDTKFEKEEIIIGSEIRMKLPEKEEAIAKIQVASTEEKFFEFSAIVKNVFTENPEFIATIKKSEDENGYNYLAEASMDLFGYKAVILGNSEMIIAEVESKMLLKLQTELAYPDFDVIKIFTEHKFGFSQEKIDFDGELSTSMWPAVDYSLVLQNSNENILVNLNAGVSKDTTKRITTNGDLKWIYNGETLSQITSWLKMDALNNAFGLEAKAGYLTTESGLNVNLAVLYDGKNMVFSEL